jgi:hypothetical protein
MSPKSIGSTKDEFLQQFAKKTLLKIKKIDAMAFS